MVSTAQVEIRKIPNGIKKNGAAMATAAAKKGARQENESYRALLDPPEQTLRPKQDDGDENDQWKCAAILRGNVGGRQIIEHAKDDTTENGAANLIESADDGSNERGHAECLPIGEFREINRTYQYRCDRNKHGIEEKSVEHHSLHGDAQNARQQRILRGSLHLASGSSLGEQEMQNDHGDNGDREHRQALGGDDCTKDADVTCRHERGKRLRLRTVEILYAFFEEERQRDGRNDQRQYAVFKHRIDDDELEQNS